MISSFSHTVVVSFSALAAAENNFSKSDRNPTCSEDDGTLFWVE